ncbi:MAG: SH3 domain-containing protein [Microscillaceae bacterium]|nr:SH3 domain-containing protein [Microscillaceae bacterium]
MKTTKYCQTFFIIFMFFCVNCLANKDLDAKITEANALFERKKFTESLELFEEVFAQTHEVSPNMLIKMAFVSEGLGNYTDALYYLSLLYLYAPQDATLIQMENIAHTYRLSGYEHSDLDYIRAIYQRYFTYLAFLFLGICGLGFIFILYLYYLKQRIALRYKIPLLVLLSVGFFLMRFSEESLMGIVIQDKSYLMSAPSSGSKPVEIIAKGHRVFVLGKQDIWYKILWNEKELYIKESNLRPIQF